MALKMIISDFGGMEENKKLSLRETGFGVEFRTNDLTDTLLSNWSFTQIFTKICQYFIILMRANSSITRFSGGNRVSLEP
jgi:hypothetical protein